MQLNLRKRYKQKTLLNDILGKLGFDYKKSFFNFLDSKSISKATIRLGSEYGYWDLIENQNLYESTIISGGVGENLSFDIEFLNKFKGKVILVDPTPRSLSYIDKVLSSLGNTKKVNYKSGGIQPIESYDLSNLEKNQFFIEAFALHSLNNKILDFYPPKNSEHVSYSLSNLQSVNKNSNNILKVETTTLKELMKKYNLDNLNLLKLDIEGAAEEQVIPNMLKNKIFPDQILVEFDNLHFRGLLSYIKASLLINKLLSKNYELIKTNYLHNMLFVKKSIFS